MAITVVQGIMQHRRYLISENSHVRLSEARAAEIARSISLLVSCVENMQANPSQEIRYLQTLSQQDPSTIIFLAAKLPIDVLQNPTFVQTMIRLDAGAKGSLLRRFQKDGGECVTEEAVAILSTVIRTGAMAADLAVLRGQVIANQSVRALDEVVL